MIARGGKVYSNPRRAQFGQGTAPTQPDFMESNACNASTAPASAPPLVQEPFLMLGFLLKHALMWEGVIAGVSDCLVKRMGSDAWRGRYQGISVSAEGTGSYLHLCLVCGVSVMCIHLSARK